MEVANGGGLVDLKESGEEQEKTRAGNIYLSSAMVWWGCRRFAMPS